MSIRLKPEDFSKAAFTLPSASTENKTRTDPYSSIRFEVDGYSGFLQFDAFNSLSEDCRCERLHPYPKLIYSPRPFLFTS
jgi:hypothetical protein